MQSGGDREEHSRRRGKRRAAAREQCDEPWQHEKEEHRDRDCSRAGEQQRIDRRRHNAPAQLFVALQLIREAREGAVDITAALAGAHESDVQRRKELRISRKRRRERLAAFHTRADLRKGSTHFAARDTRSGIERLRERHANGEQRRHGARHLEHFAAPAELESAATGLRRRLHAIRRRRARASRAPRASATARRGSRRPRAPATACQRR